MEDMDIRSEAGVPPRTSSAASGIASRSERWARTSRVLQVARVRKSEADAERAAPPPKRDDTFVPAHVQAQFTIDSLDDLEVRNAREARNSRGGAGAAAVANPPDAPFVLPSMNAMLKFRAFMKRWRTKWAERPSEKPCIERPKGDHVVVTRNKESIRRALADPSTVRCTHLLQCDGGGYGGDEEGYWGADGRWEEPAVLRVMRVAAPGTPSHAKHVQCRFCFNRLQARRVASVASCRRCQMSVPRSVMVMRQRGGGGGGDAGSPSGSTRTGMGMRPETNPFGSPFKSPGSPGSPGSSMMGGETAGRRVNDELPLCIFCEKLESKQSRVAAQLGDMAIGPSPLQLETRHFSPSAGDGSPQSRSHLSPPWSASGQGDLRLAQRLNFRSPPPESPESHHTPQRQRRQHQQQSTGGPVVGVMAALAEEAGEETGGAEEEASPAHGHDGGRTPSPLARPPRHRRNSTPGIKASIAPSLSSFAFAATNLHSPSSATPTLTTYGDSTFDHAAAAAATPPTPSFAPSSSAASQGLAGRRQSSPGGDSPSRLFDDGRAPRRRIGAAGVDVLDVDMSRLMTHPPGGRPPLPSPGGPHGSVSVTPVCRFMDCDDVPDIAAVAAAAAVRWDPVDRVIVSTERERRFLYAEERRSVINEHRRCGPEDGLRGEPKEARLGFLKVGDEPSFVSKRFPKWDLSS